MKAIPAIPRTLAIAPRIIWFEPPERALADPIRFMAYAMTYARHEDMRVIREYVSDDDFREALDRAPPGIIDPRSREARQRVLSALAKVQESTTAKIDITTMSVGKFRGMLGEGDAFAVNVVGSPRIVLKGEAEPWGGVWSRAAKRTHRLAPCTLLQR